MRKLGPIFCLESLAPPHLQEEAETLILFHGFGADAYDLRSLADVLITKKPMNLLFPQGPLEVPIGPGWTGRAWWQIDMQALQEGRARDLANEKPTGLAKAREQAFAMIDALKTPWNKIHLGGFSQGAMLATDLFLNAPEAPQSLTILSGALINKEEWKSLAPKRKGSRFFMSHGTFDPVLPHRGASQLESLLIESGLKGSLMTFQGAHEIPMNVIEKLRLFF